MTFPIKIKEYIDESSVYLIKRVRKSDDEESFIPTLDLFLTYDGTYVMPTKIYKNCTFNDSIGNNKCNVETEIFGEGGIEKANTKLNIIDYVDDIEANILYTVYTFEENSQGILL